MPDTSMSALKPCPFCGGQAKAAGVAVACTHCGATGPLGTEPESFKEWNFRPYEGDAPKPQMVGADRVALAILNNQCAILRVLAFQLESGVLKTQVREEMAQQLRELSNATRLLLDAETGDYHETEG